MIRLFHKNYRRLSDEELMERVMENDDNGAFDELYCRYARRLQGFFFRMLNGDEESASDFCQETFLKIWSFRRQYKQNSVFRPWLFTMAYNLCRNEYRHREHENDYNEELCHSFTEDIDENYESKLDNKTLVYALERVVNNLSENLRTLYTLRFEEEMSIKEIAQIMNIPEGTVKSRLFKLLNVLKEKLKAYETL